MLYFNGIAYEDQYLGLSLDEILRERAERGEVGKGPDKWQGSLEVDDPPEEDDGDEQ